MMQVKVMEPREAAGPGVPGVLGVLGVRRGGRGPAAATGRAARRLLLCAVALGALTACQRRSEVPTPDNRSTQPEVPASSPMPQPSLPPASAASSMP